MASPTPSNSEECDLDLSDSSSSFDEDDFLQYEDEEDEEEEPEEPEIMNLLPTRLLLCLTSNKRMQWRYLSVATTSIGNYTGIRPLICLRNIRIEVTRQ